MRTLIWFMKLVYLIKSSYSHSIKTAMILTKSITKIRLCSLNLVNSLILLEFLEELLIALALMAYLVEIITKITKS